MARKIMGENAIDANHTATGTFTFGTNTGTAAVTLTGLRAPLLGARVAKWYIKKLTAGTGTGDITCYLVASGGTSSTRQVSDTIVIDVDAAGPTYQEGNGWNPAHYSLAATDMYKSLDLRISQGTTNTNAPDGIAVGVVWSA